MTGRAARSRQEPLGPDETFSALVTRLIVTNRAEKASRDSAGTVRPSLHVEPAHKDARDTDRI
jgi:hypothetical protein